MDEIRLPEHMGSKDAILIPAWRRQHEEAKAPMAGTLEPLFRLPRRHSSSNPLKDEPRLVTDLHLAVQQIHHNPGVFRGEVKEPTYLGMDEEDQQQALKVALEEEDPGAKDPFLFEFENMEDMEIFLTACCDQQGLKVNSVLKPLHSLLAGQ